MSSYKEPVAYAKQSCDTMMRKFRAEDLPPKGHFHYHQGVFLSGVYQTYCLCGEEAYFTYIKDWVDSVLDE
ncbi:glycoside hydrolase family 88 protein, partial [Eisenbergiella sp.]